MSRLSRRIETTTLGTTFPFQAVIDKDQLADIQPALYLLYTQIKEDKDSRMCAIRTNILEMVCIIDTRTRLREDALTMF